MTWDPILWIVRLTWGYHGHRILWICFLSHVIMHEPLFRNPETLWTLNNQRIAWQVVDRPCFTLGKHQPFSVAKLEVRNAKIQVVRWRSMKHVQNLDESSFHCFSHWWIFGGPWGLISTFDRDALPLKKNNFPGLVFLLWEINFHAESHLTRAQRNKNDFNRRHDVTPFQLHYHFLFF